MKRTMFALFLTLALPSIATAQQPPDSAARTVQMHALPAIVTVQQPSAPTAGMMPMHAPVRTQIPTPVMPAEVAPNPDLGATAGPRGAPVSSTPRQAILGQQAIRKTGKDPGVCNHRGRDCIAVQWPFCGIGVPAAGESRSREFAPNKPSCARFFREADASPFWWLAKPFATREVQAVSTDPTRVWWRAKPGENLVNPQARSRRRAGNPRGG